MSRHLSTRNNPNPCTDPNPFTRFWVILPTDTKRVHGFGSVLSDRLCACYALIQQWFRRWRWRLSLCVGRTVVHPLLAGEKVVPETFPSATIYFSSIDNFMQYTEHSSPHQVDTTVFLKHWQLQVARIVQRRMHRGSALSRCLSKQRLSGVKQRC